MVLKLRSSVRYCPIEGVVESGLERYAGKGEILIADYATGTDHT